MKKLSLQKRIQIKKNVKIRVIQTKMHMKQNKKNKPHKKIDAKVTIRMPGEGVSGVTKTTP